MRDDLELSLFPVRHEQVFLFFSKKINTLALVSGDSPTEAIRRLEAANPTWKVSRHLLVTIPVSALERAGMLDENDISYSRNPNGNSR